MERNQRNQRIPPRPIVVLPAIRPNNAWISIQLPESVHHAEYIGGLIRVSIEEYNEFV